MFTLPNIVGCGMTHYYACQRYFCPTGPFLPPHLSTSGIQGSSTESGCTMRDPMEAPESALWGSPFAETEMGGSYFCVHHENGTRFLNVFFALCRFVHKYGEEAACMNKGPEDQKQTFIWGKLVNLQCKMKVVHFGRPERRVKLCVPLLSFVLAPLSCRAWHWYEIFILHNNFHRGIKHAVNY